MEDLYDQFQIQLLGRNDINSRVSVANNSIVKENWKLVVATLTFYSVALAETASTTEGFFTYLHNQEIQRKDIPSACRDFIQTMRDRSVELINNSSDDEDYSADDASDDEDYSADGASHNLLALLDQSEKDKCQIKPTHNPPLVWPVGTYSESTSTYQAIGYCDVDDIGECSSFVLDFNTCESRFAKVTEIIGDWKEEPGNWGPCMSPKSIRKEKTSPIIKEIALNLDNFRVRIEEIDPKIYEARFTPIRKVHHAASMLARKCTIQWTETNLKPIQIMNKVVLRIMEQTSDNIIIETEYLALDCL